MRINHNISALNAYRNLAVNNTNTAKSLEKLSSGLRINKASDDAAGLAISEKMRSQIRGLEMAERNALDGISLIQTAEGALSSSHDILQRMRELAVQAANDSYTDTDRAEIQKEVNQLTSELNRIGNSTEFNSASLLDGSRVNTFTANGKGFANGLSPYIDSKTGLQLAIVDQNLAGAGIHTAQVSREYTGKVQPSPIEPTNTDIFAGPIMATPEVEADAWTLAYQAAKDAQISVEGSNSTGVTVNVADGGTNLTAGDHTLNVIAKDAGFAEDGSTPIYDFFIEIGGNEVPVAEGVEGSGEPGSISTTHSQSGIVNFEGLSLDLNNLTEGEFTFTVEAAVEEKFSLSSSTGLKTVEIQVGETIDSFGIQFTIGNSTGLSDGEKITFNTSNPVDGYTYHVSVDGKPPVSVAINQPDGQSVTFLANEEIPGLQLNSFGLQEGNFVYEIIETGTGKDDSLNFQIGANSGQTVGLEVNDMRAKSLNVSADAAGVKYVELQDGTLQKVWFAESADVNDGVSKNNTEFAVDLTSHEKAQAAISIFSDAIQQVSSERSRLGSIQNRLEHTVNNLRTMTENVTSSESRIRDLDMAKEMSTFTKNNILNQAAQAMLSQANQMPQGVLQLLK